MLARSGRHCESSPNRRSTRLGALQQQMVVRPENSHKSATLTAHLASPVSGHGLVESIFWAISTWLPMK